MRLRLKQKLHGLVDGRQLDRFEVGRVYEVGTSLANYLLAINAAEPAEDHPVAEPTIDPDASAESRSQIGADAESAPYANDRPRTRVRRRLRKRR